MYKLRTSRAYNVFIHSTEAVETWRPGVPSSPPESTHPLFNILNFSYLLEVIYSVGTP